MRPSRLSEERHERAHVLLVAVALEAADEQQFLDVLLDLLALEAEDGPEVIVPSAAEGTVESTCVGRAVGVDLGRGCLLRRPLGRSIPVRGLFALPTVDLALTGVWMGQDNNTPLSGVTGGTLPAEIWGEVMTRVHKDTPIHDLPMLVPYAQNLPKNMSQNPKAGSPNDRSAGDSILRNILRLFSRSNP